MFVISIPKGTIEVPTEYMGKLYNAHDHFVAALGNSSNIYSDTSKCHLIHNHYLHIKSLMVFNALQSSFDVDSNHEIHQTILCYDNTFVLNGVKFAIIFDTFCNLSLNDIDVTMNSDIFDQDIAYFIFAYLDEEEGLVYFRGIELSSIVQQAVKQYEQDYCFKYNPFKGRINKIHRCIEDMNTTFPFPF